METLTFLFTYLEGSTNLLRRVAQAVRDRLEERWEDPEDRYRRDSLDRVRAPLGDAEARRATARGMALSFNEAFNLAMGTGQ